MVLNKFIGISLLVAAVFGKKNEREGMVDIMEVRRGMEQISSDIHHEMDLMKGQMEQIQLSIAFLQQMAWGVESKSIPPFMLGQQETQRHKDEEGKGMFKDTEQEATERRERERERERETS